MKRMLFIIMAMGAVSSAYAWHPHRPAPPPPHHYHGHHHHYSAGDAWAAAGIGVAAGVVGAAIYNSVRPEPTVVVQQPQPVVVQQPVVIQQQPVVVQQQPVVQQTVAQPVQNVWVDGRYVDQVQANGTVVRTWQPGHYEQR